MFDPAFPLARIEPAPYNLRAIEPGALEGLARSLLVLGFCKPLLVTTAGLLVAGHQRVRVARQLGMQAAPAWVLAGVTEADEVTFNQLHNGADLEAPDLAVRVPPSSALGFERVLPADIEGPPRSPGAQVRATLCQLVLRYGAFGAAVATQSGAVVASPHYALACRQLGRPCRVYRLPDALEGEAREAFGRPYGAFAYGHLPRSPWMQTLAQMHRLREGERSYGSTLYEKCILPVLGPAERLLDFGAGQGDYLRRLRAEGRPAWGVEPYLRAGHRLDPHGARALADEALAELAAHGPFDVVVADAVLNSVDSLAAERDVLLALAALCRPGGRIYLSGRRREGEAKYQASERVGERRPVQRMKFLDADGFTATHRGGAWFYQRLHRDEEVRALAVDPFGDHDARPRALNGTNAWQLVVRPRRVLPDEALEGALRREFDLPLPGGECLGRGEAAVTAWREGRRRQAA